jgi:hypothetical protein
MDAYRSDDAHAQLRALYRALLEQQENFDEFKQLLALYPPAASVEDSEPEEAAKIRNRLNDRIRAWVGDPFEGLTVMQVLQWRAIIVEERFNVVLSPWKESNGW